MIDSTKIKGAIIDLDGVITRTMHVHIKAWKMMLDEYLALKNSKDGKYYAPFDIIKDYPNFIDGVSRNDGVRNFVRSRGIEIEDGKIDDVAGYETICGLGNKKFENFTKIVDQEGVEVYPGSIEKIADWKRNDIKTCVISSSHTTEYVLQKLDIIHLFDVVLDGRTPYELGLRGKPSPDIYLEAANRLFLKPDECMVIEDSVLGVTGAKRGGFGYVIGVDRANTGDIMSIMGADLVVHNMMDII